MPTKNIAPLIEPVEELPITEPDAENKEPMPGRVAKRPFVLENTRRSGKGNMTMMISVVGVILLFGIGMLAFLSSTRTMKKKTPMEAAKPNLARVQTGSASGDLIPSNKVKSSPEESGNRANVDPSDIERTKAPKMAESQMQISSASRTAKGGGRLADIPKFEEPDTNSNGAGRSLPAPNGSSNANDHQAAKREEEELSKPSIVFTAHRQMDARKGGEAVPHRIDNLGLEPGFHVAARLEAMATTAVHVPVTAIVEFNYERNGQILIPAGSRMVGKITQADPSGLINITFSSIEFPGGETVPIEAVAADMTLQAIKGKVTGKQAGKSMLVRSLSGIGETAAMIVGAPSANSAFSENDLLRMRMADNIGNASDEQIMRMMTMQHIVVSVPAGTEIYVIFAKASSTEAQPGSKAVEAAHDLKAASLAGSPSQP
jgi:Bacterial conjugation TrbI-like protein